VIPGFTSTASKRPDLLFGTGTPPLRMVRAEGCRVWDDRGREYVDCIMALGAVALGYGHPDVVDAAARALRDGTVGPLAPTLEQEVAERLVSWWPWTESVRFLKTGAEAVSAAIRVARVVTGRDAIVCCGYQGWLDGLSDAPGVPTAVRALRRVVPFGAVAALEQAVHAVQPAALVVEPVVDAAPATEWIEAVNRVAREVGAILVLDEIKTGIRFGVGGAAQRYGYVPDLVVIAKAIGNGLPLSAVLGPRPLMDEFTNTWVSSTLATEFVSLAAANTVLDVAERVDLGHHVSTVGRTFYDGLITIADRAAADVTVKGIPEFCYLAAAEEDVGARLARACAERGVLFKRNAYNFVSLAHDEAVVEQVLGCVADALDEVTRDR